MTFGLGIVSLVIVYVLKGVVPAVTVIINDLTTVIRQSQSCLHSIIYTLQGPYLFPFARARLRLRLFPFFSSSSTFFLFLPFV